VCEDEARVTVFTGSQWRGMRNHKMEKIKNFFSNKSTIPKEIRWAVICLFLSAIVIIVDVVYLLIVANDEISASWIGFAVLVAVAVNALLIYFVIHRLSFVRWVLVISLVLSLLLFIDEFGESFGFFEFFLDALIFFLDAVAVYLMFTSASNAWFSSKAHPTSP
jgi:hypothetical protein